MKRSINFDEASEAIIDAYRRSKKPIPNINDAVNELIQKVGKK